MNKQTKKTLKEAIITTLICIGALLIITTIMQLCGKIFL